MTIQDVALAQAEPSLFHTCPVPACPNLVDDPRQPCGECLAAFGPMIRPSDDQRTAEEFAAAAAAGDAAVRAILAERRTAEPADPVPELVERKRNQLCWLCEQRRSCRPDPDHSDRWVCRECEASP